jgi:uncharacterized protein (TIGR00251 family)
MTQQWCSALPTGVRLTVQITPNAKKSEVVGILDDALKIKLQAQPIDGKANEALIRFIADKLGLPRRAITITHGHANKHKLLEVTSPGLTAETVKQALFPATPTSCSRTPV